MYKIKNRDSYNKCIYILNKFTEGRLMKSIESGPRFLKLIQLNYHTNMLTITTLCTN